jgi:hypothetical protein
VDAEERDARVIVEVEPAARFAHMLETLFGLAERHGAAHRHVKDS